MISRTSAADPVFLTPGSGIRIRNPGWKKIQSQSPGTGLNIPDLIFENLESGFWLKILKFFYEDLDLGSGIEQNRIRIWDKHLGSATLSRTHHKL
jgi:hypothetical protein